ncbi:Serpin domain - like 1 [Theobroma cacao]|nr:Serpin domain - like 1 [Theobroma cacao]
MDVREMIRSQTDVALSLTKHVLTTQAKVDSNLVFSPLSAQVVLSAIAVGSNGSNLGQLLCFLKSTSNDYLSSFYSEIISAVFVDGRVGGPRLSFSNGVWVDKSLPLKHSFRQIMKNVYKAASNQVDFQTEAVLMRSEVNLWAEKETNGLIKQVLPPGSVNRLTRLIFANALDFKGVWNEKFDSLKTKDHDFYLTNGSSVQVPFMTSKKKQYIRAYDGFKVLGLPYKQGGDIRRFTMYIFQMQEMG